MLQINVATNPFSVVLSITKYMPLSDNFPYRKNKTGKKKNKIKHFPTGRKWVDVTQKKR